MEHKLKKYELLLTKYYGIEINLILFMIHKLQFNKVSLILNCNLIITWSFVREEHKEHVKSEKSRYNGNELENDDMDEYLRNLTCIKLFWKWIEI